MRPIFYYNTTKNIITAFGSLFDEIRFVNDYNEEIRVPISFAPKEKFIEYIHSKPDQESTDYMVILPRMAFELDSMNFAPERHTNPLNKFIDRRENNEKMMFNRIAYDYNFSLYIASKKFEESLKIVEQILPFFTPTLNLTIKDKEEFQLSTDIPIVLNTVSHEIDYEGSFDSKRTVIWTIQFTAKAFLYSNVRDSTIIKKAIVDVTQKELDRRYFQLTEEVIPNSAGPTDPHEIEEIITYGN